MAKKKESIYKTWDEVDEALKKLGEMEIKKAKLEGDLTIEVNDLKSRYLCEINTISAEAKNLTTEITRFCEFNKDEFLKKRSKKFNFGTIAYKISEKVVYSCESAVIKSLKALNLDFCLRVKETIDKDSLKELDAATLTKIGASIVKSDKLTVMPDIVKIAAGNELLQTTKGE